ncbi:MAG: ComEC/Rec2 family competence protein [Dictyoglomaceae bacterium]
MDKIPPSGFFFIYFITGIFLQRITGNLFYLIIFFLLSCLFIKNKYFFLIPSFLFFLFLGFFLSKFSFPEFKDFTALRIKEIRGYIEEIEEKEKIKEIIFKPYSTKEKILLFFPKKTDLKVGSVLSIKNLEIFPLERGDAFRFWSKEITLQGKVKDYQLMGKEKLSLFLVLKDKVKEYVRNLFSFASYDVNSFLKAVILGEMGTLPQNIRELFINTGTAHLLAVSGLHITLLIVFLTYFLNSKRIKLMLNLFLFFYAFIVDKPPVFRAVGMYFCFILAKNLIREEDTLNSFFIVGLISLILSPLNLFNISFQLSYLATLGLIISPSFKVSLLPKYFQEIWKSSLCLFLFLLPFNIYFFQRVPFLSLISNFFSIPLFHLILLLSFTAIFISFSPLSFLLLNIVDFLTKILFCGLQWIIINYKISLISSIILILLPLLWKRGKE